MKEILGISLKYLVLFASLGIVMFLSFKSVPIISYFLKRTSRMLFIIAKVLESDDRSFATLVAYFIGIGITAYIIIRLNVFG
jgi:hypothetical protein